MFLRFTFCFIIGEVGENGVVVRRRRRGLAATLTLNNAEDPNPAKPSYVNASLCVYLQTATMRIFGYDFSPKLLYSSFSSKFMENIC